MGNLMTSFNAGVSGLHSAQQSLTVTSHNLANAGTVGYTRQQVLVTDSFYQKSYGVHDNVMAVGTGTTISLTRQVRNTFLDDQYRLQVGRQQFYQANSNAALEIEDMLGARRRISEQHYRPLWCVEFFGNPRGRYCI